MTLQPKETLMATQPTEPKQTNQSGEGRKDEKKGTSPGRDLTDQHTLGQATSPTTPKDKEAQGGRNSSGGEWGKNKGKGGDDSHNKR